MKTTISAALAAIMTIASAQAATITFTFTDNTGADFSSYVDGPGPIVLNDIAAMADGEAFTFDLTLTGILGDGAVGLDFTGQRVLLNGALSGTKTKSLSISISDVQGNVTFNGFTTVDRYDNVGGDPWDVNGETISATGNSVALAAPITGPMTIVASDVSTGNTRFEGFQIDVTPAPEPSSAALLGLGGIALILRRRK